MQELIRYFVNLLILQYKNKPKAKATIEALTRNAFSDTTGNIFPIEVQNAYNLDTATGKQLDILGKYIGYDRVIPIAIDNTFKYATYDLSSNPNSGYGDYWEEKISFPYAEYRYTSFEYYSLEDNIYKGILKMNSYLKGKPLSLAGIDEALDYAFDGLIYVIEKDKELEYHIAQEVADVLDTQDKIDILFKKYFPRPMGCTMSVVRDPFFLNVNPVNGAENYIDENFIYTRTEQSSGIYLETFNGFNVLHNQKFEIQIKFKIDSSDTFANLFYTAIDGDNADDDKKYDFGLAKRRITTSFALTNKNSLGQVQYIDLINYTDYTDTWVTFKMVRNREEEQTGAIVATLSANGETIVVNSHWGLAILQNAYFIFGVDLIGSIDLKETWIKIDNNLVWRGVSNKRIQGV